jgi:hypothetical protein
LIAAIIVAAIKRFPPYLSIFGCGGFPETKQVFDSFKMHFESPLASRSTIELVTNKTQLHFLVVTYFLWIVLIWKYNPY